MKEGKFSYALTNPLSIILNKPPSEFQRQDMLEIIEKNQIERITFHYTALDGRLKELKLPAADHGSLDFICRYLTQEGERAPFAPDNILAGAHGLFKQNSGMELHALGELEFYLITENEPDLFPREPQKGYHESSPFLKGGEVLTEIVRHITQITDAVKYAHSEVGFIERIESELPSINGKQAEQMEVEFVPRSVEEAADALVISRWVIRNVALRHRSIATFTPKLVQGGAGNGLHIHLQLMQEGRNIMEGPDGRLSEAAERLVGGLCTYADSLLAFGNTVASSYMRLVPHQEAPTKSR